MKFQKMHGLGNDFILFNDLDPMKFDLSALAIRLCDRHQGIGADGIILILPSEVADVKMRIINSDGSEANMCGNGIRCFAKYIYDNHINRAKTFTIETGAGIMIPELIIEDENVLFVKVNMGAPVLERAAIPMIGATGNVVNEDFRTGINTYKITSLLMGVPHTMIFVDHLDQTDIVAIGREIEKHPSFPEKTNVWSKGDQRPFSDTIRSQNLPLTAASMAPSSLKSASNRTPPENLSHRIGSIPTVRWLDCQPRTPVKDLCSRTGSWIS